MPKPEQKFNRLMNPTCLEDYGLILTESELRRFPEGREILLDIKKRQHTARVVDKKVSKFIKYFNEKTDSLIRGVMNNA